MEEKSYPAAVAVAPAVAASRAAVAAPPAAGAAASAGSEWPQHVQLIISALESAHHPASERRAVSRAPYRSKAHLRLFTQAKTAAPALLYTRDVCPRGMGFVTPHYLPLGYGGKVEVLMPDGRLAIVHCTLSRCRQLSPGWYEGALSFSREQMEFAGLSEAR